MLILSLLLAAASPALTVEKFTLDNGLEVLVHEDHRLPLVAVNVTYHVGAIDEATDRTGFAHLFEHLMFQGSKHVGDEEHLRYLSDAGGSDVNGYTTNDYTVYLETVPTNEVELALWLESDRMGYLLDTLDDKKFENQREVVKNERRQRFENAPYGLMRDATAKTLFPPTHPYFGSVIGSMTHLNAASVDDAKRFFVRYYAPSNATLALAGDITVADAKAMVARWFGSFPKLPKPQRAKITVPEKPALERFVLGEKLGKLNRAQWLWIAPVVGAPGEAELDFVSSVLGEGESSRLYKSLVLDQKIASNVGVHNQSLAGGSMFVVDVTGLPNTTAKQLEDGLQQAWATLAKNPFTDEEVARVKARYETSTLSSLISYGNRARTLQIFNHYEGKPDGLERELERHRKLTAKDLGAALTKYLPLDKRATIIAIPQKEADASKIVTSVMPESLPPAKVPLDLKITELADEGFRKERPKSGPIPQLVVPKYQSQKLANGLTVIVNENHQWPLVQITVNMKTGAADDPKDRPGLYGFLYDVLDEGTQTLDVEALDKRLGELGTNIGTGGSRDSGGLGALALKQHVPALLPIIADMTMKPRLDPTDIERVRKQRQGAWLSSISSPNALAGLTVNARLFGKDTAYGHPQIGDEQSLAAITREQLLAAHASRMTPGNTAVIFVGDVTLGEAVGWVEAQFKDWKGAATKKADKVKALSPGKELAAIDVANAPQTILMLAAPGPEQGHPDEEALSLALDALGGNFNSRLNLNLREDKGITYGAGAGLQSNKRAGLIFASSPVRAEATGLGLQEMVGEVKGLVKRPISQGELDFVRNAWLLSLTSEFESLESTANAAGRIFVFDQPLDTIERDLAKVRSLTLKDIAKVSDKYLKADKFTIVVVGDPQLIDRELGKAGLGTIKHQAPPAPTAAPAPSH